ncbi:MAG: rod shape-determining protein MreC [Phycisphaerales bacterium]
MSRSLSKTRLSRLAFPGAVTLCLVLAFAPARLMGWAGWTGSVVVAAISPLAHPVTEFSLWLAPGKGARTLADDQRNRLEGEIERYKLRYLQAQLENERLHDLVEQLAGARQFNPAEPIRPITASVMGDAADASSTSILRVRAGRSLGVTAGTVATDGSVQLLGRVQRVFPLYSEVRPITAQSSTPIQGRVLLDAEATRTLECILEATGDGMLRGDVEDPGETEGGSPLEIGQRVCLKDRDWPDSAQMLTIGTIVAIEPSRDHPLRKVITVRPGSDLRGAAEVVLRIPVTRGAADAQARADGGVSP